MNAIESYTREDYITVLKGIKLTPSQKQMLQALRNAPNHTASVRQLCESVGGTAPNPFNGSFGTLAKKVAYALDPNPRYYLVNYLFSFPEQKPELIVRMRQPFLEALETLAMI